MQYSSSSTENKVTRTGSFEGPKRRSSTEDRRLLLVLAHVAPVVLDLPRHCAPLGVDAAMFARITGTAVMALSDGEDQFTHSALMSSECQN